MLRNFFKTGLRNLLRYKTYSLINITGLTLGIACALFIFLLVNFELSYDQYHTKADRIYRINSGSPGLEKDHDMGSSQGLAPALREEFPEFEEVAVAFKINPERTQIEVNNEKMRENETYFVQPQFFNIFDFKWIHGDAKKSLSEPYKVVITESLASQFFKGDALGKSIRLNNSEELTVSGVIQDPPVNSDFPIHIAVSHATLEKNKEAFNPNDLESGNSYYQTYILLKEGADSKALESKFKDMVTRRLGKEKAEKHTAFSAMSLHDIHFKGDNFNKRTISREAIQTLRIIGLFILVIACINFTNLASAQAIRRSKEVGIRKTLGSSRKNLVIQFLGETFLVTLVSLILSYVVLSQLILWSKNLTDIPLQPEQLYQTETIVLMTLLLFGVTILSGFYPAFVISGFKPVAALKNASTGIGTKGLGVRKTLIAFQFMISQVLIICTFIVMSQTNYFTSRALGFDKEAVLTTDIPVADKSKLSSLRNNLLQYPEIRNVSFSLNTPAATINKYWGNFKHASMPDHKSTEVKFIDSVYFRMFGIEAVAGTTTIEGDSATNVVVNETLVKEMGLNDPANAVGENIAYYGIQARIVGVVRDFQTVTLHEGMHSVLLARYEPVFQKVSVKITNMDHAPDAIRHLQKHWKEAFPEYYFTYAFLDEQLATFYKEEKKISGLLLAFAFIAIGVGCIGLLGLIMFVSAQRTKEVGIRKILGATIANIVKLLSRDFIKMVLVAGLIAWPIAYYAMDKWLQGFANRISLKENSWIFIASAMIAVLFALVTVGYQSVKAALANPTDSLRSE